jgi:hypothetical protein
LETEMLLSTGAFDDACFLDFFLAIVSSVGFW